MSDACDVRLKRDSWGKVWGIRSQAKEPIFTTEDTENTELTGYSCGRVAMIDGVRCELLEASFEKQNR